MSYSWRNKILALQIGFFHLVICMYSSSMSSHDLMAHFFLVLNTTPYIVWIYYGLFIHLLTIGYLGCFQVLAFVNKAEINMYAQY